MSICHRIAAQLSARQSKLESADLQTCEELLLCLPLLTLRQNMVFCRYLGDERFQLALSVGLGMNIMGGDQFREQQSSNGASRPSAPEPKSSPAQPETPKQVLKIYHVNEGLCCRGCMQHTRQDALPTCQCLCNLSCIASAMGHLAPSLSQSLSGISSQLHYHAPDLVHG